MEDFFKYLTKKINPEEIDLWTRTNNIIPEKIELFSDFCVSLGNLIENTYLGGDIGSNETKINMTREDDENHFKWCWNKNIDNFSKEGIFFEKLGPHYDYFNEFFEQTFYMDKKNGLKIGAKQFFDKVFDLKGYVSKSDLDTLLELYKMLESKMSVQTYQ